MNRSLSYIVYFLFTNYFHPYIWRVFSTIADFQISASDKYKPAAIRIIEYISKSSEKNVKLSSEGADSLYQQEKICALRKEF